MFAGAHRRLPDGAFIDLAVAHDDKDAAVALLRACRERHAHANRKSVAERSGRGFDSGDLAALGVTAQYAIDVAKLVQMADVEKALIREDGIEGEAAVPLA